MSTTIDRQALAARIADASLLRGSFTLRSGRTSSWYLDKYRFSTRPEILRELGTMFAERMPDGVNRLAGAELGGIPLVTAASLASGLPTVFIRNQKKEYGTARQLEGILEAGDRVLLVEDVATTGGQVLEAVAVIDRGEGARENIEGAGHAFDALFTAADLGITGED